MRKKHLKSILLPAVMSVMGLFSFFLVHAQTPLTVTASPNLTLAEGARLNGSGGSSGVSVKAAGGTAPYTYQWKKEGAVTASLGTSSSVSIIGLAMTDSAKYSCIVTDNAGNSVESATILLSVTRASTAPVFLGVIGDMTVAEATTLTLSTNAAYWSPIGVCTWYKADGTLLTNGTVGYTGGRSSGPSFTFTAKASVDMNGSYYCVMTNSVGSLKSNVFKLTVTPATASPTYDRIANIPIKDSVQVRKYISEGSTDTGDYLDVNSTNYTSVVWKKDGSPVAGTSASNPARFAPWDVAGKSWQASDAGTYVCEMSNSFGITTSIPVIVTIIPSIRPTITAYSADTTVEEGDSLSLWAVASGMNVTYQWVRIINDTVRAVPTTGNVGTQYMSVSDTGTYYCIAHNVPGNDTVAVHVSIKRSQPMPQFVYLKDQYDENDLAQRQFRVKGLLSETLTLFYIDNVAGSIDSYGRYQLKNPTSGGNLSTGKHLLRLTNTDGTLVLERYVEIK